MSHIMTAQLLLLRINFTVMPRMTALMSEHVGATCRQDVIVDYFLDGKSTGKESDDELVIGSQLRTEFPEIITNLNALNA